MNYFQQEGPKAKGEDLGEAITKQMDRILNDVF